MMLTFEMTRRSSDVYHGFLTGMEGAPMGLMGFYGILNDPDGDDGTFEVPDGMTTLRVTSFGGGGGSEGEGLGNGSNDGVHRSKHSPVRRKLKRARKAKGKRP